MPIRFRCAYCNQLMGIARRKQGTVVRCPNCGGQVVVPQGEGHVPDTGKGSGEGDKPEALFERSDFEEALQSVSGGKRAAGPPVSVPTPAAPKARDTGRKYDAEPLDFPANLPAPSSEPPGIYLSPAMATLLSVAVVVALALAFTAGLIVGRFLYAPPTHEDRPGQSRLVGPLFPSV